jgi:hypothetical protein
MDPARSCMVAGLNIPTLRLRSLPTTPLVFQPGSAGARRISPYLSRAISGCLDLPLGFGSGIGLIVEIWTC